MPHHVRVVAPKPEQLAAEERWASSMLKAVLGAIVAFTAVCALDLLVGPVAVVVAVLLVVGALVIRRVWS